MKSRNGITPKIKGGVNHDFLKDYEGSNDLLPPFA